MRLFCGMGCALFVLCFGGIAHVARGQESVPTPATPRAEQPLTAERIELLRKEAAESTELDDATQKNVAEIYRSALAELRRAAELTARAAAFKADAEAVGQRVADTRLRLDELKRKEPAPPYGGTLAELEQALPKLELQVTALKKTQAVADGEPKSRSVRRKEIRGRLLSLPERLAEFQKTTESLPPDEHALVQLARRTELVARQLALECETPAFENELTKYDAEDAADLVRFRRDLCAQDVALAERHLQWLEERIKEARTEAVEQAVRKARDEAIAADPVLESYAKRNRDLAEKAKLIAEKFDATDNDLKTAKEAYDELLRQFEQSCKKVESVGLSSSVGAMLRKQLATLPDVRKRRAAVSSRRKTINETQYELLRRRNLSMEHARQRAAAAQASEPNATLPTAGIVTEQTQPDLSALNVQTQRLLATGMLATTLVGFWLIWVEVLPALSMLDQWPLWTTTTSVQVVDEYALPAVGSMTATASSRELLGATRTKAQKTSITFSNVAFAVLIALITFMSARDVPGLLEMSVLQRLPLDASVRYAITSLVSYGIVLIGVIVACSNIGLRWTQIQWLATALTFGLAFGLQEMFANFVAGLIILFERPVRVGDVVTVDDVTGVVSRIRIRATSITNWDRKEYVVPNKEFITGRLLNWTLSDKVNRVVVSVGIAYGSDTERARELLLKAANEHALILKDPPSLATFEGFGDNSLNFTLRTFLPSMENRLQVIHELHTAIDKAFRAAGIEIAFPQRDLHIRALPEALTLATPQRREHQSGQREAA